jgi:hypothetical protein
MPEHPKILEVGGDAGWLWICMLAYARRNKTDGIVPVAMVGRISDRKQPMKLAAKLIKERLAHESGHDCKDCVQPLPGNYILHGYPSWQGTVAAEEASVAAEEATRGAKSDGGVYGNHRRWHVTRGITDPSCEFCATSLDRSESESDDRSHMRSESDGSSDGTPSRSANRTSDGQLSLPPQTPPSLTGDITPPTPPAAKRRGKHQKRYDYGSDPNFLRFWDAFPEKSGKQPAFEAWLNALQRGANPDTMIAKAETYRNDPKRNPLKTKYPQGWLNEERYNDESGSGNGQGESGRFYEF